MKKAVTMVSIFLLVLTFIFPCCAKEMPQITVITDKTELQVGENITVSIEVNQSIEKVGCFEFYVWFDPSIFSLEKVQVGTAYAAAQIGTVNVVEEKRAYCTVNGLNSGFDFVLSSGTIATFTFVAERFTEQAEFCVTNVGTCYNDLNLTEIPIEIGETVQIRVLDEISKKETSSKIKEHSGSVKWFSDVHGAGHWAREAVDYVTEKGLFGGMSPTTFAPNIPMNRAMLMTVLARMDGQNTDGGSIWYEKGMQWAMDAGISDGTNPLGNITREQMAAMLYRYSGNPDCDGELTVFPDYRGISTYAVNAMKWAVAEGLIHGMNGKLEPQGSATRAQVATILMRYMDLH